MIEILLIFVAGFVALLVYFVLELLAIKYSPRPVTFPPEDKQAIFEEIEKVDNPTHLLVSTDWYNKILCDLRTSGGPRGVFFHGLEVIEIKTKKKDYISVIRDEKR